MKCKKCIMLINEYLDNELDRKAHSAIEAHLLCCEKCRQHKEEMEHYGIQPVRQSAHLQPSSEVWKRIATRLDEEKKPNIIQVVWDKCTCPPARFVALAASVIIIVTLFTARQENALNTTVNTFLTEQTTFLAELADDQYALESNGTDTEGIDFGTSLEDYFLS